MACHQAHADNLQQHLRRLLNSPRLLGLCSTLLEPSPSSTLLLLLWLLWLLWLLLLVIVLFIWVVLGSLEQLGCQLLAELLSV
jgi:hypothetical protein